MKKQKEDLAYKFWREYSSADIIQREKKLKPIIKRFDELSKMKDKKIRQHCIKIGLMSYFDDLIEYMALKQDKK
jgi:hypothetical protein